MNKITKILGVTSDSIDRTTYFITNMKMFVILIVLRMIISSMNNSSFDPSLFIGLLIIIAGIVAFASAIVVLVDTTKGRLKDIGKDVSYWPLIIVPFINIPFFIFLCLKEVPNKN